MRIRIVPRIRGVEPGSDVSPPTAPVIAAAAVSSDTINVTLTDASTDASGVASYSLERATNSTFTANLVTEATGLSIFPRSVTGLSASTQFFFRARATDSIGNVGAYSASVSATTQSSGGSGETVGTYAAMNLQTSAIYRLSMSSGTYPTFVNGGSTHVNEASGSWDGGPCAKFTGPTTGDGQAGVGGLLVDRGGTFAIRKLNLRFEMLFGSTYQVNYPVNDIKFVIIHSANTLGGATNERPMANWAHQSSQATGRMAFAVASGTNKQFNPNWPPNQFGPDGGEQFYIGPTTTTFNSKPVIGANTWLHCEIECITESTAEAPSGRIRGRVINRAGTVLTDIIIPWNYDPNWGLNRFVTEIQTIGGFYNTNFSSIDANTYHKVAGVTLSANRPGLLGPRAGFVV